MGIDKAAGARRASADAARPGRRAFLRMGAGCALPLLAGGAAASPVADGVVEAAPSVPGQDATDPVLACLEQELARTYHAMRGPSGVRGEHVRSLAANLELTAACLEAQQVAPRAEAAIRRRLAAVGRDVAAQEFLAAFRGVAAGLTQHYGIVPRPAPDASRLAAALEQVGARGLSLNLRGHRAHLHRLAADIDGAEALRRGGLKPVLVRQKPGDDFQGLPEPIGFGLTGCELIAWLVRYLNFIAALLALSGEELPAGIAVLISALLDLLAVGICNSESEA